MKLKVVLEQMETAYFLFAKQKVEPNYLILLQCFTISTAGRTDGHLFAPDGETPLGIIGEKLSLKELLAKPFRTVSNGLVSSLFIAALLLFFSGKEKPGKNFLMELYKNLTVEVLSYDNSENLQFDVLTGLCVQIGVRLENLFL